jgi:hypothetical protein
MVLVSTPYSPFTFGRSLIPHPFLGSPLFPTHRWAGAILPSIWQFFRHTIGQLFIPLELRIPPLGQLFIPLELRIPPLGQLFYSDPIHSLISHFFITSLLLF